MAIVLPVGSYDAGPPAAAPVTWGLSAACVAATVLAAVRPEVIALGGVVPATAWTDGLAFSTAPWIHSSALHLLYNLTALWVFGPPVERHLGAARFAAFAAGTGAVSLAAQAAVMAGSSLPIVGASGLTAALLGAFLVLHARAHVSFALVFLTVPVPVRVLATVWLSGELLTIAATTAGWFPPVPVAHVAHLTGFALGAAILQFWPKSTDSDF